MAQPCSEGSCTCCAKGPRPTTLDLRDGIRVGLVGTRDVFERFHSRARRPSPESGKELLAVSKVRNYVPPSAEDRYGTAMLRQYAAYCSAGS